MRRTATLLLVSLAVLYAVLCLALWVFQERLVFFPGPAPRSTPAGRGLEFRELELESRDGVRLHAWFLPAPQDSPGAEARRAVLVSHGNAGSIEGRLDLARMFLERGYAVLLYDYRGYGRSAGSPSEEGLYLDAEAALDGLLAEGYAPGEVVAYGESLGAAVTLELALRRPLGAVVIESAFLSLEAMGRRHYGWLPVRLLLRLHFDNGAKVARVGAPLAVLHSPADSLVPVAHGRELFERALQPKLWLETEGDHNDGGVRRRVDLAGGLFGFLDGVLKGTAAR